MTSFELSFVRPWTIRTPIVTRVMKKPYIDAFFEDGSLRISSFDVFRKHSDEKRRDGQEGTSAMEIGEPNGTLSILGVNAQETYLLCGSHLEIPLCDLDNGYGQLRILDTVAFANAISRQIPGFVGGVEGSCIYRSSSLIRKKGNRPIAPPTEGENAEKWFKEQNRYVGSQTIDSLFLKDIRFKEELEYRLVWFAEGSRRPFIEIKSPAAREVCEVVSESS